MGTPAPGVELIDVDARASIIGDGDVIAP